MRVRALLFDDRPANIQVPIARAVHGRVVAFAAKRSLYVCRKVTNADEIIAWAKSSGFETTLPADDMHVTVCYSREAMDWSAAGKVQRDPVEFRGGARSLKVFGKDADAVVLTFDGLELQRRWQQFLDAGASWDHDGYHPHITISFNKPSNLNHIAPYSGPIVLGPEIFEQVKENWHDGIKEHASNELKAALDALEAKALSPLRDALEQSRDALLAKVKSAKAPAKLVRDLALPRRSLILMEVRAMLDRAWEAGQRAARAEVRQARAKARTYDTWDESKHPRHPAGAPAAQGGEFAPKTAGLASAAEADPEFKKLFDGSKVVDKNGKPLLVFRGAKNTNAAINIPSWFTSDPTTADVYAGTREPLRRDLLPLGRLKEGAQVQPAFLAIRNPVDVDFSTVANATQVTIDRYKAQGYDGMRRVSDKGEQWFIPFDRAQVISAVSRKVYILADADVRSYDAGIVSSFVPNLAVSWLRSSAFFITGLIADRIISEAKGIILNGIKTGEPLSVISGQLLEAFIPFIGDDTVLRDKRVLTPHRLETIVRTNTTAAYNHGRLTYFMDKDVLRFLKGVRYSAILDERTTEVCNFLHGKVFKPSDKNLEVLLPPLHFQCRSVVVPIVAGEKIDESEFITPSEVGRARELADAKFLAEKNEAREYQQRDDD